MEDDRLYSVGRLKRIAPNQVLKGHAVRACAGTVVLDSSVTDGAGRFLLEWARYQGEVSAIEVLDCDGRVAESMMVTPHHLTSPEVLAFSGEGLGEEPGTRSEAISFQADGDSPICVTSACIPVTLSWSAPVGSVNAVVSPMGTRGGLPPRGTMTVTEEKSTEYKLRTWPSGDERGEFTEKSIVVKRYPSMSIVAQGSRFGRNSTLELGFSTCCPAPEGGVKIIIMSSDRSKVPEMMVEVAAGSRWIEFSVPIGDSLGNVDLTAVSPGWVRDSVALVIE